MGKPVQPGGMKLEIASRDLPRGNIRRPGNADWERNAYNLNWIDFSTVEAQQFLTNSTERVAVPRSLLQRLAQDTLKDNVRGQCGWKKDAFQDGELFVQLLNDKNQTQSIGLSGYAIIREGTRVIGAELHGQLDYDKRNRQFTRFDLVAAGQRQGKSAANGRSNDLGPAPIGFAYTLY